MNSVLKEISVDKFSFINDRRDVRLLLCNYDFEYLKGKIDAYVSSLIHESSFKVIPGVLISKMSDGYVVLERPLDAVIAKIISDPNLVYGMDELYNYIVNKIEPYVSQDKKFFDDLKVKVSRNSLALRYIDVKEFMPLAQEEIESIIERSDFFSLVKRCYTHCYQNPIKANYDTSHSKYVCVQNKHILLAYQLINKYLEEPKNIPDYISYELKRNALDPFFKKIRVDEHYSHSFVVQKIPVKDIHLSSQEDIVYGLIHKDPPMFKQLLENIVNLGLKPVDVNCYKQGESFFAPSLGVYPILGMKLLNSYKLIEKVYPEYLEDMLKLVSKNKQDFTKLNFSYNTFEDDVSRLLGYQKVLGILTLPQVKVDEEELKATILADIPDKFEQAEDNPDVNSIESEILGGDDSYIKDHKKSVTETIELNLYMSNEILDERMNAPIKYGLCNLNLNEIEAIDYKSLLLEGLSPRYKSEVIDYIIMKKEFPVLHATPCEEGLYRISTVDQKVLLARMIALCPRLVKDIDSKFYDTLLSVRQFYDVKKIIRAEVKIKEDIKIKKGNIFHHLTDGKLDRGLLKKKVESITFEEMIEISIMKDKDILERFNPVKDPVIFYRTVRSFLECLFHLYYIKLDNSNIYHDNGKWTDKFKPLSAWVAMYRVIMKKNDIADKVFPKDVWKSFNECMRMDIVFMLNELVHMALAAERYKEECMDFIVKNAAMENVIVYILNNIKS